MDPFTIATLIGSGALNVLGNVLSRPADTEIDADKIFKILKDAEAKNLGAATSTISQTAGQQAAARGLGGGAEAQLVTQASAPAVASSAAKLNQIYADLQLEQARAKDSVNAARNQWQQNLLGDLAGGVAAIGGAYNENKSLGKLQEIFGFAPKEDSIESAKNLANQTGKTVDINGGKIEPNTNTWKSYDTLRNEANDNLWDGIYLRQPKMGGLNAHSFMNYGENSRQNFGNMYGSTDPLAKKKSFLTELIDPFGY